MKFHSVEMKRLLNEVGLKANKIWFLTSKQLGTIIVLKKATLLLPETCLNKLGADDLTEIRLYTDALGVFGVKNRGGSAVSASLNTFSS